MIYKQVIWGPVPKAPPPYSPEYHLSCPLIVFNLALTQQSVSNTLLEIKLAFISLKTKAGLHQTVFCMNLLNQEKFWFLGLVGFLSFPKNPLCFPYTTFWQCHLKRVFQHKSALWHQTLVSCTKFTKTFGTLEWLTLENLFHPQLENTFLVTSKYYIWFCIKKKHICATASEVHI